MSEPADVDFELVEGEGLAGIKIDEGETVRERRSAFEEEGSK